MGDLYDIKLLRESGFSRPHCVFVRAAGLPGSGRWRGPHPPRHMGERLHDASASEQRAATRTYFVMKTLKQVA